MVYSCKYGRSSYVKSCRMLTSWFTSTINVNGLGLACLNFLLILLLLLSKGCCVSTQDCSYSDLVDRFPWFLYQDDFSLFPSTNESGQCLLNRTISFMEVCEVKIKENKRMEKLRTMYTNFCGFPVLNVLTKEENNTVLMCNYTKCRQILGDVEKLDSLVEGIYCDFVSLLDTYDWQYGSSTSGNPEKCKTVYKRWLCSAYVPYYDQGERISPCGEFCDAVTEFCPFFRPITLDTQTGEPSFLCKDPSINHDLEAADGVTSCCYKPCHVDPDAAELCPPLNPVTSNSTAVNMAAGLLPLNVYRTILLSFTAILISRTVLLFMSIGLT